MSSSRTSSAPALRGWLLCAAILAEIGVASCGGGVKDPSTSATPVRIALTNTPVAYLPVLLADALGYYRGEGLSITIDDLSSASKVMQALLAGSADVGAGSYEQDVQLAAEGRHVKSFVLTLRQSTRVLAITSKGMKKIKHVEDLKGAVIGVAGLGSINHVFLNYILLKHGIAPSEVKTVAIGTAGSAIAAVQHEMVDAAVLGGSETTFVMRHDPGIQVLVDPRGVSGWRILYGVDVYPTAGLQATDQWLRANPDKARRIARAVLKTLTWISEHSPEQVLAATSALPNRGPGSGFGSIADHNAELLARRDHARGRSGGGQKSTCVHSRECSQCKIRSRPDLYK